MRYRTRQHASRIARAAITALYLGLISCGGNGASRTAAVSAALVPSATTTPAAPIHIDKPSMAPPPAAVQAVSVHATYMLPASITTSSSSTHVLTAQSVAHRQLQYVSASNTSISIAVTPTGGSTSTYGPSACTSTSCAISFTALPGPTTLTFTLTNGSAQTLSTFSRLTIVQPNTVNTLSFTASPVVSSVTLQLASTSINAGTPTNVPLTVNALDASGNTIVGNGNYVDVNGNPVSIILSSANSQNGGRGTASIQGPGRITAPGQAAIALHYDGNWLDHTTVTATATSSAVNMSGATATLTTIPYATEYATGGNPPIGIVAGPDKNMWFTQYYGATIGKMTLTGTYTAYSCSPCNKPTDITVGSDGNLWFTEDAGGYIDKITTAGTSSRVLALGGDGARIRRGPGGALWYTTYTGNQVIGKLSPNGTSLGTYALGVGIRGIGFGADGSLWYATLNSTTVGHLSLSGAALGTATVGNLGSGSDGVVAAPDGNIWFTNNGSNQLDKVTPAGGVTAIALQSGAMLRDIVVGPDGKLWFTEFGTNTIGVIAPGSTTPTEFTNAANGINASADPVGITVGPDGNIWFTEPGIGKIAKLTW